MGKWKISCKCQQCGLWFGHLRILEFWFHPWLWELIRNVFYLKIHWTSQVLVQVSEPVGLSFIFLFVLIIIIGPTFIIFISPPALAFISMPIIFPLLAFFSPQLLFLSFLRPLFVELISDLRQLVSRLQLVFMIGPQLISQLAWLLQFIGHWMPIVILF